MCHSMPPRSSRSSQLQHRAVSNLSSATQPLSLSLTLKIYHFKKKNNALRLCLLVSFTVHAPERKKAEGGERKQKSKIPDRIKTRCAICGSIKKKKHRRREAATKNKSVVCMHALAVYVRTHAVHCCYRFIQNRSSHRGAINWESDAESIHNSTSTVHTHTQTHTLACIRVCRLQNSIQVLSAQEVTRNRQCLRAHFFFLVPLFVRYFFLSHCLVSPLIVDDDCLALTLASCVRR